MITIENILNRFGYYKTKMPEGSVVTKAEITELFKNYKQSEMFTRLLRDLCAQDIRLYFQATTDADRQKLRGEWSRTNYFISLIQESNDKRTRKD